LDLKEKKQRTSDEHMIMGSRVQWGLLAFVWCRYKPQDGRSLNQGVLRNI